MISFLKPHILVGAIALIFGTSAQAEHYKVFLLGGQSNMTGNGPKTSDLTEAQKAPQDDVWVYGGTDESASKLGSLQPGFGSPYGPEISFGRTIADGRPYENFALIKYSKGGTNLHTDWDPATGNTYNRFKTTVGFGLEALTKAGHTYEVVGMLWTQGERDAAHERTTAQYEADLNEFIADIRTRYGADVAFFISRLSILQTGREPGLHDIRAAQDNVAAADPNAYLIDTDSFAIAGDNIHFTGTGLVALGNAFGQAYLNSLPVDASAPQIDTLSPVHTAPAVEPTANLSMTFDEEVVFGTGNITLRQAGGTLMESYDVADPSANLTLSGATLTIDPSNLLAASTGYYIEIAATAIVDHSGNPFAGISGDGTWSFTTSAADTSLPVMISVSPANGAPNVRFNENLTITFTENVGFGSGNITLRQTGGTLVESYAVTNPPGNLTLSGNTLTINPTNDLLPSTGYYLEIDAAAIDDHAGNSFAGLVGSGAWAFTTAAPVIDGSVITATASRTDFNSDGTARGTSDKTIDGSGLSGGEHGSALGTYCLASTTIYIPIEDQWFQWDLGASHTLGSIHVWNFNLRSVDIYFSNVAIPGGTGSGNWTRLGGASLELPAAGSPNTGFDLAAAIGATLPITEVRHIRFEANTNWSGGNGVAISEIQFSAGPAAEDETPPAIETLSPANGSNGVSISSDQTISFNEAIAFGSGNITLRQSGGALVESFDVATSPVGLTLSADTVTINPSAALDDATTYYFEIDGTAIVDLAGNSYAGISGDGTWSFTTVLPDTTAPTISTLNPTNGANDINSVSNLIVTFNEVVAFGSGNITLKQSGGAVVETFDVGSPSPALSLNGDTVTINPTADLALLTTYYVEIDGTAIEDLSGNPFAGFSGDGSWSFTTVTPETIKPAISTLNPTNGQNFYSPTGNLQITFTEEVAFGTGNITLRQSGGSVVESFDVANPPSGLTLSGATVTIDPGSALALSTTYYVEIPATAIDDLAGNSFDGFTGNGTWSFTTAATLQVGTVDASGFYDVTDKAVVTTDLLDWGYVSRQANNNQSGGFGSISEVNANNVPFGSLALGGYGNLTTVSGSSSIGTVTFTEGAPSDVLGAAFTSATGGWYSFDGMAAHGDMRGMNGNEQDVWTLTFSDLGVGQFDITLYLGISKATANRIFDMDYSLVDGNTISGTSTSATANTYSLYETPAVAEDFYLFTYQISVTATTAGADLSLTFGGVSGDNGGEVLLSGYTVAAAAPGNIFIDWIGGYTGLNGLTAFDDDADGDGIDNGVEAFFGSDPSSPNAGLSEPVYSGGRLTFTHSEADSFLADVIGFYEWSLDLFAWNASGDEVGGTTVSFSSVQNTPQPGTMTVTATVTGTEQGRVFVRAAASQN